jgi:hypothetical protein
MVYPRNVIHIDCETAIVLLLCVSSAVNQPSPTQAVNLLSRRGPNVLALPGQRQLTLADLWRRATTAICIGTSIALIHRWLPFRVLARNGCAPRMPIMSL